jgi:hypothetical protein
LRFGASFAPEQWGFHARADRDARLGLDFAVKELGLRQMRLGIRWSRGVDRRGNVDLSIYAPYIDYCLNNDVEVCLNVGPIRTFRWPEEHVPAAVAAAVSLPPVEGKVQLGSELAQRALAYLEDLLQVLRRNYGDGLHTIQVENEPYYPLGKHLWRMSLPYMHAATERVDDVFPNANVLVTSAGRLHLNDVRDLFIHLLATREGFQGRLVSGFDFHYKTPNRDAVPVVRHFDQIAYARPFAPSTEDNIHHSRSIGYGIEVTEGQAEPYGHFTEPGNSAREFRFMLLRCLDKVFDPKAAALLRIWGVEELAKKILRGRANDEHHQIVELIQTVNGQSSDQGGGL